MTPEFAGEQVAVLGLGRSGRITAQALAAGGAQVLAWDDDARARAAAHDAGISLADPEAIDWRRIAALVPSPGVPLTHPQPNPVIARARAGDVPIIGDIELFARSGAVAKVVGITGTNGKSTTTALLGHVLKEAGREVQIGANLGAPVLGLDVLDEDGVYVLELSSYQLDLTQSLCCDVAVLLNLSPDHLDRHGDMAAYIAAKRRIFSGLGPAQTAVVGIDDAPGRAICEELGQTGAPRVVPISAAHECDGVFVHERTLVDRTFGKPETVDLTGAPALLGAHNMQNTAAALAAARALALSVASVAAALNSFAGLPHRLEDLGTVAGVRFINDSKATNAEAAARALACFDRVYWIGGGRAKGSGLGPIEPYLDRIRHAFLIGEAAGTFGQALAGRVRCTGAGELRSALTAAFEMARADAQPGAVVLLSPACASFDQWSDFEARGEAFGAYVAELKAEVAGRVPR